MVLNLSKTICVIKKPFGTGAAAPWAKMKPI